MVWTDLSKGRKYCSELLSPNLLLILWVQLEKTLECWYQFTLPSPTAKIKVRSDSFVHSESYILILKTQKNPQIPH